jgi:periplasmic protein CpxP/Spy
MENKSLKYWKGFAIILIALNITLIVFLLMHPPMGRPGDDRERGNPGNFIIEKLKFTDAQQKEFNKLKEAHHDSIEILQAEGKKLRKSFFQDLKSDSASHKYAIAAEIAENQKQIELLTYNHFEKVKKLCTPEQKEIFNSIIMEVVDRLGKPPREPR